MIDILDSLQTLLSGGPSVTPAVASTGMVNYGAAPTPQAAASGPAPTVLARLKPPPQPLVAGRPQSAGADVPNPLGISPTFGGANIAAAMGGLARVNPQASRFGAFAQGLAGGLSAQQQAQIESQKLGIAERQADLEGLYKGAQIQNLQTQLAARQNAATTLQRLLANGGGAPGAGAATPAPTASPAQPDAQPAASPPDAGGAPAAPAAPSPAPTPAAAAPPADPATPPVRMIPHAVARSPDFWATVDPESNPAILNRKADAYEATAVASAADPATEKRYSDAANQLRMRAQGIRHDGMVTLNDGSAALIPGFAHSKAMIASITAAAEESARSQYQLEKVQPTLGGPTMFTTKAAILAQNGQGGVAPGGAATPGAPAGGGAPPPAAPSVPGPAAPAPGGGGGGAPAVPPPSGPQGAPAPTGVVAQQPAFVGEAQKKMADNEVAMADQFQKRQVARDRLQTMVGILKDYQPGAFAEQKADMVARLRGVGIAMPDSATANPAAFQQFVKYASANVLSDVAETSGNSQPLVSEMEAIKKANANPELQPAAVAALLSHSLGVIDYKDAHYKAYNDWKKTNPYAASTGDFETGWAKDNPISKYTEPVVKSVAYQGQDLPDPTQRKAGQTYMTPKGPLVWQGTGWSRPTAAAQ